MNDDRNAPRDHPDSVSDEQLDRQFGIGHHTLRATLEHLVFNIEAWTAITTQPPLRRYDQAPIGFGTLPRRLRDTRLLDTTFTGHFDEEQSYGAAAIHVLLHNEGHRAELLHLLARPGANEPQEVNHALWDHARRQEAPGNVVNF